MTGREKPKRKALHRGLDDIVRRDASLTSRLLGRVKPPVTREPLDLPPSDENTTDAATPVETTQPVSREKSSSQPAPAVRMRSETVTPLVSRKTAIAPEKSAGQQTTSQQPLLVSDSSQSDLRGDKTLAASEKSRVLSFKGFVERWSFFLKSGNRTGKLRICEVLYDKTYTVGEETYFTSYDKLAKLAGLEKKQCAINIKQLEDLGFVERLNIYNTATRQGTEFKLHLTQLPPELRKNPRYHYYDEDV